MEVVKVILHALLAFFILFVISKILGKKQVAQLEFTDYVIGISIGSIAAQMAIDPQIPYYHFIVGMAVFGFADLLITIISRKATVLKQLFKGAPIILVDKGKLVYKNLKKSKLDINEVLAQCRTKGYFNLSDIEYCIFETSGDFSILPKSQQREIVAQDLKLPESSVSLSTELVIDGKIIKKALQKIKKDNAWLFKKLKIKSEKEIKKIMLAIYDESTKELDIHYKNNYEI